MKDSIVNLATAAKREIHATRNVGRKRKRSSAFSRVSAVRRGAALASTGMAWQWWGLVSTVERSRPVPSVVCGHARKVFENSASML